jgi:TonB-linked SusC/RagA family outer membrane protein
MKRVLYFFVILLIILPFTSTGQEQPKTTVNAVLKGSVRDSATGRPLSDISVQIKGITNGTTTDDNGEFTLYTGQKFPFTITVTSVGYEPKEIVAEGSPVNVLLKAGTGQLEGIVVVGYGTQRKKDLTGSVTTVSKSFIENRPLTNSSQALQGVQGLYVNQAGGQPGNDVATIRIRGIGTINNNDPLVLLNGVPYDLKDINPADIESISVLKDASAASIYGSRAANGVILVTTKEGKKGTPQVSYNDYFGWQKATYLPDVVTNIADYMVARNQASVNENQPLVFTDADIESARTGTDPDLYPNADWYGLMFKTAPIQNHTLQVSGGGDAVLYAVSLDYLDQDGILIQTSAKRYSLNANLNFNITRRLKAGLSLAGTYWNRHEPEEGANTLVGNISRALPFQGAVLSNGNYADQRYLVPGHNVFRNPYAKAIEGGLDTKTERIFANAFAEYTFPLDIVYKLNFAVNKYDGLQSRFVPQINLYSPYNPDSVSSTLRYDNPTARSAARFDENDLNTSFFQTLSWNKTLSDVHNISLLAGYSRESFNNASFDAYIEGFLGNELTEINAGTTNKDANGTSSKTRLESYFGRATYNFDRRYFIEFDFRYDGSSRFAKNNRWGFFPAVSGAWRISNEAFFRNVKAVNDLKIRGSWGRLGNQNIPLYSYLNGVDINQGYSFNNSTVPGSAVIALSDPNISWETTTVSNIGLDLGLWNGLLGITVDAYNKKTTDILARINVPAQVGNLQGPVTNLYSMSNKGLEITVTHEKALGKYFRYNLGAGIAFNKNKVDFLNGDVQYSGDGSLWAIKEGYPVNSYYLYVAEGIFQSQDEIDKHAFQSSVTAPGDIKYKDLDGNGKIDSDDRIITGRTVPQYTYNFNLGVSHRRFNLTAFFQGVQGIDMYPIYNLSFPLYNGAGLTKDQLENSWTQDYPDDRYPRLGEPKRGSGINYKNSTFWLRDASYLRIKNILLSYDIPVYVLDLLHIKKARLFINVQNYLTFSKYKNTDPERNTFQQDISEYPTVKTITVGVNINF